MAHLMEGDMVGLAGRLAAAAQEEQLARTAQLAHQEVLVRVLAAALVVEDTADPVALADPAALAAPVVTCRLATVVLEEQMAQADLLMAPALVST